MQALVDETPPMDGLPTKHLSPPHQTTHAFQVCMLRETLLAAARDSCGRIPTGAPPAHSSTSPFILWNDFGLSAAVVDTLRSTAVARGHVDCGRAHTLVPVEEMGSAQVLASSVAFAKP